MTPARLAEIKQWRERLDGTDIRFVAPGIVDDVEDLLAEVERLTALLRNLEWSNPDGIRNWPGEGDYGGYCPYCVEERDKGHYDACELAALLARSEGE